MTPQAKMEYARNKARLEEIRVFLCREREIRDFLRIKQSEHPSDLMGEEIRRCEQMISFYEADIQKLELLCEP